MDAVALSNELAEEIRTNTKLRHRLGMEEGSQSSTAEDSGTVHFETKDGQSFILEVREA